MYTVRGGPYLRENRCDRRRAVAGKKAGKPSNAQYLNAYQHDLPGISNPFSYRFFNQQGNLIAPVGNAIRELWRRKDAMKPLTAKILTTVEKRILVPNKVFENSEISDIYRSLACDIKEYYGGDEWGEEGAGWDDAEAEEERIGMAEGHSSESQETGDDEESQQGKVNGEPGDGAVEDENEGPEE